MATQVGPYELGDRLGKGGMGTAYRATDTRDGTIVALKLLHPHLADDADAVARLRREARIAEQLDHPNITRIIQSGDDGEQFYITMELVDGETLGDRLRRERRVSERECQRIALAVANALGNAHAHGIVHRDIKPGNVLLGRESAIKVADFGVSRATGSTTLTHLGTFVGTPAYAAPEVWEGATESDIRTDLYAAGIMMYEMVLGRVPFESTSPNAIMRMHQQQPPDMGAVRVAAPNLAPIISRLLEKQASKRYADPEQLIRALSGVSRLHDEPVEDARIADASRTQVTPSTRISLDTLRHMPVPYRIGVSGILLAAIGGVLALFFLTAGGEGDPVPAMLASGTDWEGAQAVCVHTVPVAVPEGCDEGEFFDYRFLEGDATIVSWDPIPGARWIWKEDIALDEPANDAVVTFTSNLTLDEAPSTARITVVQDACTLIKINGATIMGHEEGHNDEKCFDDVTCGVTCTAEIWQPPIEICSPACPEREEERADCKPWCVFERDELLASLKEGENKIELQVWNNPDCDADLQTEVIDPCDDYQHNPAGVAFRLDVTYAE